MASTSKPSTEGLSLPAERPQPVRHLSALEVDDESPSPSPVRPTAQRSALGVASGLHSGISSHLGTPININRGASRFSSYRPSMSSLRSGRIVSRRVSRAVEDGDEDGPKLPSLVPGIRAAYSTPLPMLPMVVLCIAMLSELLSANLSQPFMLKMVEGFFLAEGKQKSSEMEAAVGLWTGNLVSVFYITQFFTSLLWSSIADRHGRRAVLVASMTGSGIALLMFGTSKSLPEAICVRLIQGIFGGAIGVFRGSIRDLTDDTNATRAYAILGFSWGLGGVIGPIIGGVFENPALNHPDMIIGKIALFQKMPYLLPTLLGGTVMFIGAILACFLSWDGGVRGGSRIQLEVEKDEPLNASRPDTLSPSTASRPAAAPGSSAIRIQHRSSVHTPAEDPHTPYGRSALGRSALGTSAGMHRESMASLGTAYGYGGIRSKHPTLAARRAIEAARRVSTASGAGHDGDGDGQGNRNVSFATKLLLANEDNTFNINDLWLSAAVAQDTAVFDDDDEYDEDFEDDLDDEGHPNLIDIDDAGSSIAPDDDDVTPSPSAPSSPTRTNYSHGSTRRSSHLRMTSGGSDFTRYTRRPSSTSRRQSVSSQHYPSIFSNTGVASTPGISAFEGLEEPSEDPFSPAGTVRRVGAPSNLAAIREQGRPDSAHSSATEFVSEKQPSRFSLLPLLVIAQYGLLSCHDSTHGQIFLSFIVTPYQSGGVGISPASYSLFVALMCVGQLFYQFYLFPRLGPPLGRFSHLQMFRLGSALCIPGYLLVPLLHLFASSTAADNGGFVVMSLMTVISAIRYCGGTFSYTSIMILINAMSPPHLIGLANGLAQSTVSCARFFGPALGGMIWSASINGNPSGYPKGFYTCAIFATIQVAGSFFIR